VAIEGNSQIHFIQLPYAAPTIDAVLIGSIDMSPYSVTTRRGVPTTGGGKVNEVTWDPTNNRVAISFLDSDLIALAQCVTPSPSQASTQFIDLIPLGYLRGPLGCGRSSFTTFYPQALGYGALLSTVRLLALWLFLC